MKMNFDSACDAVLRYSLYAALFLVPAFFLPVTLYAVNLNKQALFVSLVLLALVAWCAKAFHKKKAEYVRSALGIPLAALVAVTVLSAFFSGARHVGFMGSTGGETDTVIAVIGFALLYVLLSVAIKEKDDVKKVCVAFMASGALAVLAAVPAIASALTGVFGYPLGVWDFVNTNAVGTTNAFALYAGFVALVAFGFFRQYAVTRPMRLWSGILAGTAFVLVMLVGYWAAFVALAAGLAVLALFERGAGDARRIRRMAVPLVGIAACALMLLGNAFSVSLPRIPAPPEIAPSVRASFHIAQATARDGVRPFLLGSGPSTYAYQYSLHRDVGLNATPFWTIQFTQGFNAVLTYLVSVGFVGAALFIAFLGMGVYGAFRLVRNRKVDAAGVVLVSAYAYAALLPFLYPQNFVLQFLLFSLSGVLAAYGAQAKADRGIFAVRPAVAACALIAACGLFYVNGVRYAAAVAFARGITAATATNDIEKGFSSIAYGSSLDPQNDAYLQALASAYLARANAVAARAGAAPGDDVKKQVADAVSAAVAAATRSTEANPMNVQNWIGLGQVYDAIAPFNDGAASSAYAAYGTALALDPANPAIQMYIGNAHRAAAGRAKTGADVEYAAARAAYENAIALKQDYAPAYFGLIGMFDEQGKGADAAARAERLRALAPNDAETLFQLGVVHYQAKRTEKARDVLMQAVAIVPNYANALYFLGLAESQLGDRAGALARFNRVLQLNPESAAVKAIIANLEAGRPALDSGASQAPDKKPAPAKK